MANALKTAMAAVKAFYADTNRTRAATLEGMVELKDEIESMIEALEVDIAGDEEDDGELI